MYKTTQKWIHKEREKTVKIYRKIKIKTQGHNFKSLC